MVVFEYILLRKSAGPCLETSFMIIAIIEELYLEISFVIPAVVPGLYLEILFMVSAKHFFFTGATTHCGFVFCSPLAGYSLLA